MSKNTGDGELDEILGRFELVITQGLLEVIKQNLPKTALDTTLGEHRSNAKTAIKKKIAQEANSARLDEIDRIFNNPDWEDKKVGEVPSVAILDFLYERSEELTKEKESSDESRGN